MNDIAQELARLHELEGAAYSRQVEHIARMSVFHLLEGEVGIYATAEEKGADYENLIAAARKAVEHGYQVFILPNPRGIRTADYIFERKGMYKIYELKTIYGQSSAGTRLTESIGQTNRIILNITSSYNGRLLASDIKAYFERNRLATEVIVLRGKKLISISKELSESNAFNRLFRKMYEK